MPLAGVPAKALEDYLGRLVRLGRRVAICDQVEDPADAKGIVRREVTETVTPGTFELEWPPKSGQRKTFPEVDRVEWFSVEEASAKIVSAQRPFLERLTAR